MKLTPSSRYATQSPAATAIYNGSSLKKMCRRNGVPLLLTAGAAGIATAAMAFPQILLNQTCANISTNIASWSSARTNNLCFDANSTSIIKDECLENVDGLKRSTLIASCLVIPLITIVNGILIRKGWIAYQQIKGTIQRDLTEESDTHAMKKLSAAFVLSLLPFIAHKIISSTIHACDTISTGEDQDDYYYSCNPKEPCTELFYQECLRRVSCSFAPRYPNGLESIQMIQIIQYLANGFLLGWSSYQTYKAEKMPITRNRVAPALSPKPPIIRVTPPQHQIILVAPAKRGDSSLERTVLSPPTPPRIRPINLLNRFNDKSPSS